MRTRYTYEEWLREGEKRFGKDHANWKFKCPSCGYVASAADYKEAGAPQGAVGFSCIGRWSGHMDKDMFRKDGGPCNYAGGGFCFYSKKDAQGALRAAKATNDSFEKNLPWSDWAIRAKAEGWKPPRGWSPSIEA